MNSLDEDRYWDLIRDGEEEKYMLAKEEEFMDYLDDYIRNLDSETPIGHAYINGLYHNVYVYFDKNFVETGETIAGNKINYLPSMGWVFSAVSDESEDTWSKFVLLDSLDIDDIVQPMENTEDFTEFFSVGADLN